MTREEAEKVCLLMNEEIDSARARYERLCELFPDVEWTFTPEDDFDVCVGLDGLAVMP